MTLSGKVAFITGAGGGIGQALATGFAGAGPRLSMALPGKSWTSTSGASSTA